MAFNFRSPDRDQQLLMPPSLRDWLPDGHLAFCVLDATEQMELGSFYARYRPDGRGGAAYEPAMMVALLLYAYCIGERSSRRIERRLHEDVAFRVIAANECPDHATIARFRAEHQDALAGLFNEVLSLCAAAGLVRVGLVAIDGTKIAANASRSATVSEDRIKAAIAAEVARILAEAAEVDAAEDALYGDARGDELPPELADRSSRLARLREAKARIDAEADERAAAEKAAAQRQAAREAKGHKRPGTKPAKPKDPQQKPLFANTTDPDSKVMPSAKGFIQGYNAQAAATADQLIVAAGVTDSTVDYGAFVPTMTAAGENLSSAGVDDPIGTVVADAGYYSIDNATFDGADDVLIATTKRSKLDDLSAEVIEDPVESERQRAERLAGDFEAVDRGDVTLKEVAIRWGHHGTWARNWRRAWRAGGVEALIRQRRANGEGAAPKTERVVRAHMEAKLASDDGKARYRKRAEVIEPIFGQFKEVRGFRRFSRRGLAAVDAEWKLMAATHNLLKLWRISAATG